MKFYTIMNKKQKLSVFAFTAALLLGFNPLNHTGNTVFARGTSVYDGTGARPASADGGNLNSGNDIVIAADTNCCWLYLNDGHGPSFWDNNVSIVGTGFNVENGGALRFGNGGGINTNPAILTGNLTLAGNAVVGTNSGTLDAIGIVAGSLKTDSADYILTIRSRGSDREKPGIVAITSDNAGFNSLIKVGGGTLQLGCIGDYTANGYEWTANGDGTETYKANAAKAFHFDGTTGSVASAIDVTCTMGSGYSSTLKFQRSGNAAINNVITGTGKIVFDGTATYSLGTGSVASTLTKITVNKDATLVNGQHYGTTKTWDFSQAVSGAGFYQVNYSDTADILSANTRLTCYDAIPKSVASDFTGVYVFGAGYRYNLKQKWDSAAKGYSLGATDYGQIWIQESGTYTGDMYLKGNGWSTSEYRGALRFATSYAAGTDLYTVETMAGLYGNLYLMGDTRISAHADKATVGLIASDIKNYGSGSYNLEINNNSGYSSVVILTGTNSYGTTTVNSSDTLVVGWLGTINGQQYDGTSGTLGTGDVTVGTNAVLKFMRSGNVSLANSLKGTGKVIFGGTAEYALTSDASLADSLTSVEITSGAALALTTGTTSRSFTGAGTLILAGGEYKTAAGQNVGININVAKNGLLSGAGTINGTVTMSGGTISDTISLTQDEFTLTGTLSETLSEANTSRSANPAAALAFGGDYDVTDGSVFDVTFTDGLTPRSDDTLYLVSGNAESFSNINTGSLTLNGALLPSGFHWSFDVAALGNGLVLTATPAVPEPASWLLLFSGIFSISFLRKKKNARRI